MGRFVFESITSERELKVTVEGSFSQEDAARFIEASNEHIAGINPAEYAVYLDCTSMNVNAPCVVPVLEQCYGLYKDAGFHQIVFAIARNPVLKMQLGRVARTAKLENYEIIEV